MTTAQEQFDKFRQDYQNHFDRWQLKIAQDAWQACQDLNDKERESLIAENAMMREALEFISHDVHYDANNPTSTTSIIYNYQQIAKQALSAKPRLVEVGEVYTTETPFTQYSTVDIAHLDLADGTKLYTIQTDTKSVAKRKAIQRGE